MNKSRKVLLIVVMCMVLLLTGCTAGETMSSKENQITIVCTTFPLYDWTRNLLGETEAEVLLLLNNGTDMHSFQPSAQELIQIADCDILVHVGGESDRWLEEALAAQPNEERRVVNLTEVIGADMKEETITEGMQTTHVHADGTVHDEEDCKEEQVHEESKDEHVWLSVRYAKKCCDAIKDALCLVLPEEADDIRNNHTTYCQELDLLDEAYAELAQEMEDEVLLVADRFPFLYLAEDYGMEYYAAFPGCSTESEADFETVIFLAEKINEHKIDTIFITESGTDALAKALIENAEYKGQEISVLHSMQVVYQSDIENGCSYVGYMEANLAALQEAFVEK